MADAQYQPDDLQAFHDALILLNEGLANGDRERVVKSRDTLIDLRAKRPARIGGGLPQMAHRSRIGDSSLKPEGPPLELLNRTIHRLEEIRLDGPLESDGR